jgi:hypothetical protein
MKTPLGAFKPPLKIVKMCLVIGGEYKLLWIPISFQSRMLRWPAIPGDPQWIEGLVTPDLPNETWTSPNRRIGSAWGTRWLMNEGKTSYPPDAFRCTGT